MERNREEIEKIFEELRKNAKDLYPNIDEVIETFNSAQIGNEYYERIRSLLNESPTLSSSNHVNS